MRKQLWRNNPQTHKWKSKYLIEVEIIVFVNFAENPYS